LSDRTLFHEFTHTRIIKYDNELIPLGRINDLGRDVSFVLGKLCHCFVNFMPIKTDSSVCVCDTHKYITRITQYMPLATV